MTGLHSSSVQQTSSILYEWLDSVSGRWIMKVPWSAAREDFLADWFPLPFCTITLMTWEMLGILEHIRNGSNQKKVPETRLCSNIRWPPIWCTRPQDSSFQNHFGRWGKYIWITYPDGRRLWIDIWSFFVVRTGPPCFWSLPGNLRMLMMVRTPPRLGYW